MKRKVVFIILDQFADWEGAYLSSVLRDEEMGSINEVLWASTDRKPKKSLGNMTVIPDLSLEEIPEDADALILIGGNSWRGEEAKKAADVVRRFLEKKAVVGFICDATYFAAKEGFLNEVLHTGNNQEEMGNLENYRNPEGFRMENAISDGRIITANGNNPVEFSKEVLKALELFPAEKIDMWADFYLLGYWNALRKYGFLN